MDELGERNWNNILKTVYPKGSCTRLTETIKKATENHIPRRIALLESKQGNQNGKVKRDVARNKIL